MTANMPTVGANTSAMQEMFAGSKVVQQAGGGLSFLKFDSKRLGEFLFGQAAESVTDEVIAIDISTWKHGQILWHAKKPTRAMVPVNQPMPDPFDPIEYTDAKGRPQVDESQDARSFEFTFDDGIRGLYEVSTFGGRSAIDEVYAQLVARATGGSPFIFPHVKLESDSYEHSAYGLVYTPVLTPVAWYDEAGNAEPAEAAKLKAPAETKAAPEKAAEEPEPKQDATPQPRKRKRAAA